MKDLLPIIIIIAICSALLIVFLKVVLGGL